MHNILLKKGWCLCVVLILIMIIFLPMTLSKSNKNYMSPNTTTDEGDNVLAKIYLNYSGWGAFPEISVTYYEDKIYEFPADSQGRIKVNFTFLTFHKKQFETIFRYRWTIVYFSIWNLSGTPPADYQYSKAYL